jgi:pyruvate dehydrogenase E1 component alpha subunit
MSRFLGQYDPLKGEMVQVLDPRGVCDEAVRPDLSDEELRKLYRQMVLSRLIDRKGFSLQRQGRIGTYPQFEGQEAAQVGSAYALRKEDWLVPSYRDGAAMLVHGFPLGKFFMYLMGNEEGNRMPDDVHCLPFAIVVGSQPMHAVGLAWAAKIRRESSVALAYFGDGATSQGDVHEAMNFASVFQVPCIFFCQNNQFAISMPRCRQSATKTLAQRAIGYGMPGIVVDGNDLLAVYAVTKEAAERARAGGGPAMIEALTYRLGAHTTSDDPTRYREDAEVAEWRKKDPIERFRRFLEARGLWTKDWEDALRQEASAEVEAAVEAAEKLPPPEPDELFRYMFHELTPQLRGQSQMLREALRSERGK